MSAANQLVETLRLKGPEGAPVLFSTSLRAPFFGENGQVLDFFITPATPLTEGWHEISGALPELEKYEIDSSCLREGPDGRWFTRFRVGSELVPRQVRLGRGALGNYEEGQEGDLGILFSEPLVIEPVSHPSEAVALLDADTGEPAPCEPHPYGEHTLTPFEPGFAFRATTGVFFRCTHKVPRLTLILTSKVISQATGEPVHALGSTEPGFSYTFDTQDLERVWLDE